MSTGESDPIQIEVDRANETISFPYTEQRLGALRAVLGYLGTSTEVVYSADTLVISPEIKLPERILPVITFDDFLETAWEDTLTEQARDLGTKLASRAYHSLTRAVGEGGRYSRNSDPLLEKLLHALVVDDGDIVPEMLDLLISKKKVDKIRNVGDATIIFYNKLLKRHKQNHKTETENS